MKLLARASAGLILWAFGFFLLYALQGTGCAVGWHEVQLSGGPLLRWVLVATWLLLVLAGLAVIPLVRAAPSRFEKQQGIATALFGVFAMLLSGAPAALTSVCV